VEVPGLEARAVSVETHPFEATRFSLGVASEENRNSAVDNARRTLSARLSQTLMRNLVADAGFDRRRFDDHSDNERIDSKLISAGLQWKPTAGLETSIRREENIGEADPSYPTQTLLGMQLKVSPMSRMFATQRFSTAPIIAISGPETAGLFLPASKSETAVGIESRVHQNTSITGRYRLDSSMNGTDSFAILGVLSRIPVRSGLAVDWSLDDALHLAGSSRGYVGGSVGLSQSLEDKLRSSIRYELRRQDRSRQLFTAGIAGRLSGATAALARYRISDLGAGSTNRVSDGQLSFSIRPKQSDRVALLLSYDYGSTRPGALLLTPAGSGRSDRLSADGLLELTPGLEFYSRVAVARIPGTSGERHEALFLQNRIQQQLLKRFDVALEARWTRAGFSEPLAVILATEWGTWITPDFRVGAGYSSRGFANPGSVLNATAARGGTYIVISSRLSSLFDLMGRTGKTDSAAQKD